MAGRSVFICLWVLAAWAAAPDLYSGEAAPQPAADAGTDPDLDVAMRLERAFKKLASRVEPCVVSLSVHVKPGSWAEELRRMSEQNGSPSPEFEGSGVVLDPGGLIVTNEHVVRNSDKIVVKLSDGRTFSAEVCGTDPRSDLAMLRLTGDDIPKDLPCAELADSGKVEAGQWALAVGNPFGLSNTFTMGVVSACNRNMPVRSFSNDVFYGNLIQTDAAINPGNSGGPLFDLRGKLIGINTMIFSKTGASQGFGFAIPSNHLKKRLAYLKSGREVEYGWMGVHLEELKPGQRAFKVPDNKGVLISGIIPNTPADRAGLEQGTVILNFEGVRISNSNELIAAVNDTPVGRVAKLRLIDRQGQMCEKTLKIAKRYAETVRTALTATDVPEDGDELAPETAAEAQDSGGKPAEKAEEKPETAPKKIFSWRGMQVREIEAGSAAKRGGHLEIIRVRKNSPADHAGLYEGAIITEVKDGANPAIQKVDSLEAFKKAVAPVTGQAAVHVPLDGYVLIDAK